MIGLGGLAFYATVDVVFSPQISSQKQKGERTWK